MNRRINCMTWIGCAAALLWLLLSAGGALGAEWMEWITTNQVTIAWDAYVNAAMGDTISYNVYTRNIRTTEVLLDGSTAETQYTLTFAVEGRYIAGVQTVRIPMDETEELVSDITWSDSADPAAVPDPFGLKFYENPSAPIGLRPGN